MTEHICETCKYSTPRAGALACMGQKYMPYVRPTDSCGSWKPAKWKICATHRSGESGKGKKMEDVRFEIVIHYEGHTYTARSDTIRRNLSDGSGYPYLYALCVDESGRKGVVNLTPNWGIRSINME